MPHSLPWAKLYSTPPPSHLYKHAGEMGAGAQLVKHCPYPPPTQIRNDLDSGEDGRKVLGKQDLKVLVPGPRKEGAS